MRRGFALLLLGVAIVAQAGAIDTGLSLQVQNVESIPRRLLGAVKSVQESARAKTRDKMIEEEFKQLVKAEAAAEKAIEAAENDGDFEEAELQEQALEELEEKVAEVAAAEESEAAHEHAAKDAEARGDFAKAAEERALAQEAQAEAELAEEDLADAVAAEQEIAEMSLRERLDPGLVVEKIGQYGPNVLGGTAAAIGSARTQLRTRLDYFLHGYPVVATLIEWLSLVIPVAFLVTAFYYLRKERSGHFSLRSEVLLFSHMYCAGYYGLLAFTTIISPEAPLTAFARAQPEQYVSYQVFLMLAFVVYLGLLSYHVAAERSVMSGLQLAGAVVVFLHSYFTVFYPAMHSALPPTAGWLWFALYTVIFTSMTFLIKRERKGKGD